MISDALLIAQVNGETEDLTTLRRLEIAAIESLQKRTGEYYGVAANITEYPIWRGSVIPLANVPLTLTSFQQWDGSAWATVDASSYFLIGSQIRLTSIIPTWPLLSLPRRYKVVYTAGYTVSADPLVWPAPPDIQQAVLLLVSHWFRNKEGEYTEDVERALTAILYTHGRVAV